MNYKNMTEEEITYQLEWSDENEFGTNYAKFLREENKQLKEEIEEQKKYNAELMLCNSRFNAILTELEAWVKWHYDFWKEEINHGECFSAIREEIRELKIKYGLIQKDEVLENQINALIEAQPLIDKGDKENENE